MRRLMGRKGGRPPGRAPTALELRHLELLVEVRSQAAAGATVYADRLEDFVLELRDQGCSVRAIADALGVGPSTVQTWTENARRRKS